MYTIFLLWILSTIPLQKMVLYKCLNHVTLMYLLLMSFQCLIFFLFRTAEGLCLKFSKHGSSNLPLGGQHVILLGDPAQLPAVSQRDIFGTHLWKLSY